MQALKALGRAEEAARIEKDLAKYARLRQNTLPFVNFVPLLCLDWISHDEFLILYQAKYWNAAIDYIRRSCDPSGSGKKSLLRSVHASVSMLGFLGGQWLCMGLSFISETFLKNEVRGVGFIMTDQKGEDEVETPPHGRCSATSVGNVLKMLPSWFGRLKEELGHAPYSLVCGQGLVDKVDVIKSAINTAGFDDCWVHPALSTFASEKAGLTTPAFAFPSYF
uniref:Uncharacterized protein n=1 Tax=Chromera velia CCMP2878 TaxID=1169474 RepID=A0A0G4F3X9_9ALVE|mmetsp:Transcript_18439/g.37300  ORF Transcript_18439/g.37300 Transcript_18439/m.37300 type:complete len:222 (-) Transcript_18439:142-807(-)|eukprot:Cvel_15031.t1-p1 / transcript=Cvel_15031.t1 / gene=Cvel_15031 / organism=Chromera_velia_CCMP2878 / gene_product=hypothetical protein / transcript_product=hypothetical protein / location=Cvel_scaffold1094:2139-2801(-) / protein_length=221 / sequence_SO=supercontig / SO=protein_coding / is_pseudo=false